MCKAVGNTTCNFCYSSCITNFVQENKRQLLSAIIRQEANKRVPPLRWINMAYTNNYNYIRFCPDDNS